LEIKIICYKLSHSWLHLYNVVDKERSATEVLGCASLFVYRLLTLFTSFAHQPPRFFHALPLIHPLDRDDEMLRLEEKLHRAGLLAPVARRSQLHLLASKRYVTLRELVGLYWFRVDLAQELLRS
jgi:hypothetical protein